MYNEGAQKIVLRANVGNISVDHFLYNWSVVLPAKNEGVINEQEMLIGATAHVIKTLENIEWLDKNLETLLYVNWDIGPDKMNPVTPIRTDLEAFHSLVLLSW